MNDGRPWRRAIAWIAVLGPFFFASYGFANWLASRRSDVGAIAFAWEPSIPFLPWTIVPYWSIDLLYGLSLLIATTRRELDRQAQRLLAAQFISVTFFILFPLRFSFDRPHAEGLFGALFTALGSFDKPFNQAPSLHIALLILIWTRLAAHCPRPWRWTLDGWMVLIGASVLTTYQHHFIDIPTGMGVGFAVLWALPDNSVSPLRGLALTADPTRRKIGGLYLAGSILLAAPALEGGAWLWLLWPAVSLAVVSLNYLAVGARGFQKAENGRLSAGAAGLLAPYLAAAWINSRLWTRRHPLPAHVADGVSVGRIPRAFELAKTVPFAGVVDLCAELPCLVPPELFYRSIPILDLTVPDISALRTAADAIEEARKRGPVLVCCGLGYSRSAAAVVAWLLVTRRAAGIDDAIGIVNRARQATRLGSGHRAALEELS